MDSYLDRIDRRFASCSVRDIVGCNNFMCMSCPDPLETLSLYNFSQKLKNCKNESERKRLLFERLLFTQRQEACPF